MQINLYSDFNIDILKRILEKNKNNKIFKINSTQYSQFYQSIISSKYSNDEISIVWTLPENIIQSFSKALCGDSFEIKECLSEVDYYAENLINLASKSKILFLISWVYDPIYSNSDLLDWEPNSGIKFLFSKINFYLAEKLFEVSNIKILNAENWFFNLKDPRNSKMWYLAKVPFSNEIFKRASDSILHSIENIIGGSKKLIILDLDNTIWGGEVGELGPFGINLGGHDYLGEAFKHFQLGLKSLTKRGVILGIASKNEEKVALEAISKNPEMILNLNDFVGWKINWNDKAENIFNLTKELNLGLDSVVFIDDNPLERDRVKKSLPEVTVPNWSIDPIFFYSELRSMRYFDSESITSDDIKRSDTYKKNSLRKKLLSEIGSKEDWLVSLKTKFLIEELSEKNIKRAVQLLNKTNQFNLTSRRLTIEELNSIANGDNDEVYVTSISDKFGDLGIIGLIGLSICGERLIITDFLLSCRALGRYIEDTMIYAISNICRKKGLNNFEMHYLQTDRNSPILNFLESLEVKKINNTFIFEDLKNIKLNKCIEFNNQ